MSELRTHRGHRVEVLEGDAQGVIDRGKEIEDLGEQMIGAADVLREIGDGASEERGRSIEKIRDEVGDAHAELRKAGERYKPTGTVMKTYGSKLADVQAAMRTIVTDALDAKSTLDSKRHAAATAAQTASNAPDPDPTDPTALERQRRLDEAATDSQGAVDDAEADLDAQFALFDSQWDTWDEAYDTALRGITDATEGNVSDDWTDNLAGVVEVVLEVLTWVGVALAIAAIIIGGPFIAVIAAIVGVIALIGTLFLYAKGRKGLGDVAWAVVGVLPFGKLGKLFQSGKRLTAIKEFLGGPYLEIATPLRRITALRGLTDPASLRAGGNLGSRAASGLASRLGRDFSVFQGAGPKNILNRIIGGSSRGYSLSIAQNFANLSAHHQRVITPHLGALADVISGGAKPVALSEGIANSLEFGVKRGRMVLGRVNEISSWGDPQPVDTWRAQLA
ncbi:hypothetical protein [Agromyces humi]|jgi:hypothetical protein|uniref:hypothetical protein n=1 Tax=Agromyces humi TaxID=1766800 RepID=UPI0013579B1F|nr:hypothetical protein [Agromyces humi]